MNYNDQLQELYNDLPEIASYLGRANLSKKAYKVYLKLLSTALKRSTCKVYLKRKNIGIAVNLDKSEISKAVHELEKFGLIFCDRDEDGKYFVLLGVSEFEELDIC